MSEQKTSSTSMPSGFLGLAGVVAAAFALWKFNQGEFGGTVNFAACASIFFAALLSRKSLPVALQIALVPILLAPFVVFAVMEFR